MIGSKPHLDWMLFFAFGLSSFNLIAWPASPAVSPLNGAQSELTIAPFQGDKSGAVALTFDDGSENQVAIGIPLLDKYQLKASFFVIAGLTRAHEHDPIIKRKDNWAEVSWDQWREVAKKGYEIGNHSFSHQFLTRLNEIELTHEIDASAVLIKKEIGISPISFVCPYNEMNPGVRAKVLIHHQCLRDQWTEFGGTNFTFTTAKGAINSAFTQHHWLVPMIHGIASAFDPMTPTQFEQILKYLSAHRDQLWIDNFGTISCYQQERQNTQLHILQRTSQHLTFQLHCLLDPQRYQVPITVVLRQWWKEPEQVQVRIEGAKGDLPIQREGDRVLISLPPRECLVDVELKPTTVTTRPSINHITTLFHPS